MRMCHCKTPDPNDIVRSPRSSLRLDRRLWVSPRLYRYLLKVGQQCVLQLFLVDGTKRAKVSSKTLSLLDIYSEVAYLQTMPKKKLSTAAYMRKRIEKGGERFWSPSDFSDHPPAAVTQALSRLASEGLIERVHRGVYYMPRQTIVGPSTFTASTLNPEVLTTSIFPAGTAAANVLGFSTQMPMRPEYATPANFSPKALEGAIVYKLRPDSWNDLETDEGALLSFLRDRGRTSDLSDAETVRKLVSIFKASPDKYKKLVRVSDDEPARVRAMLGAIGQENDVDKKLLDRLRRGLSAFSSYDFGRLGALRHAEDWQAQ